MLLVEIRIGCEWQPIGRLDADQPAGSLSHNGPAGRQVYRFACHRDHSVLERSLAGADTEIGPFRAISTVGFEEIARLRAGDTREYWIRTDRMAEPYLVRFRHS